MNIRGLLKHRAISTIKDSQEEEIVLHDRKRKNLKNKDNIFIVGMLAIERTTSMFYRDR